VHLNDNHGVGEEHLLPGEGTVDWDAFTAALSRMDFAGPMIMEPGWRPGQQPEAMIHRARQAADNLAAKIARAGGQA